MRGDGACAEAKQVCILLRRRAVFSAGVPLQLAVPPLLDVEGRVGHHVVRAEVRVAGPE